MTALLFLILLTKPCPLLEYSFAGDRVGRQCQAVPEGHFFVFVETFLKMLPDDVDVRQATPPCSKKGSTPCLITIDDHEVMVCPCLKAKENYWELDITCKWARKHYRK